MRWILLCIPLAACSKTVGGGGGVVTDDEVPEVGWRAEITTRFHEVGGTATVTSPDTIEVSGFTYDGEGVNARLFLVVDGAPFDPALELTDNLVGTGPYDGDTLQLTLPETAEPGSWNAITLWCVPFAVSFGDGVFEAPE